MPHHHSISLLSQACVLQTNAAPRMHRPAKLPTQSILHNLVHCSVQKETDPAANGFSHMLYLSGDDVNAGPGTVFRVGRTQLRDQVRAVQPSIVGNGSGNGP